MLSSMSGAVGFEVVRDGSFASLGLLSHTKPGMLVGLYDENYMERAAENASIACVLTTADMAGRVSERLSVGVCRDPMDAFYRLHAMLLSETEFYGRDFATEIHPGAVVHPTAYVAPKNVRIGQGCRIEPGAIILEGAILKRRVVIRSGAVIGGEGFEPKMLEGEKRIITHAGGVKIGNNCEIQSNCHVAKAVFGGFTEIGESTKMDALVHIAHNVVVGKRCELAACAMVAGSTTIGDDVFVGPNASLSSEIDIGAGAHISLGAVVTRDVEAGRRVSGNFAINHGKLIQFIKTIR